MTCSCSILSPFRWIERGEESPFSGDPHFTGTRSGKTMSSVASESADAFQKRYGRSLGYVGGISPAADKAAEERAYTRRKAGA